MKSSTKTPAALKGRNKLAQGTSATADTALGSKPASAFIAGGAKESSKWPSRWQKARVGDILKLINGRAFKPTEWEERGLPIVRIQNLNNLQASFNYCTGNLPEKFLLKNGDLLFAWSGTPGTSFGAHIWQGGGAWLNQHIFKVLFDEELLNKKFLRLAINQNLEEYIRAAHGAAGLAHITKGRFEESELPIPPLCEQEFIVAEIEKQFTCLDAGVAALKRVQANLKRYRASVLKAACEGPWPATRLGEVVRSMKNGIYKKRDAYADDGTACLRMYNIECGKIIWKNIKRMTLTHDEVWEYQLLPGDLLVNRVNSRELVGKAAPIPGGLETCVYESKNIRVRLKRDIADPKFVSFCLFVYGPAHFDRNAQQVVGMASISQPQIGALEIPLPSLAEQQRIVAKVGRWLSVVDGLETLVSANLHRTDRLRQSILKVAFEGRSEFQI